MRLIDADVIIARCETIERNQELSATEANRLGWLKEMIQMMHTIDPVRHGEWVVAGDTTHYYICSVCGKPGDGFDNYCRSCGANMLSD